MDVIVVTQQRQSQLCTTTVHQYPTQQST